ncbi:predicted protein [Nematostella vectensis]|uniref:G-protein coupled receptors family 1 profile domain-containing protein n=1 Tax=Nematostella vectensis TaxID=45351 RepID=A7RVC6_NEMVE|nr:predicted protein [Nematostella vectensis]|eukprot:XP_001636683.1 predicted protein [Nematostella vectensis]
MNCTKTYFKLDNIAHLAVYFGVNVLLGAMSAVLNAFIIFVIMSSERLRSSPSYLLISNLCLTDLATGLISQPISLMVVLKESWFGVHCSVIKAQFGGVPIANFFFGAASLLTATVISIDRFIAVHLQNSYRLVVSKKRSYVIIAGIWLYSLLTLAYQADAPLPFFYIVAITISVCLIVLCVSYRKCFTAIRNHKQRIADMSNAATEAVDLDKYRHAMITMVISATVLFGVYFQLLCALSLYRRIRFGAEILRLSETIVYFNSTFNPILYLCRIRDIRVGCVRIIRNLRCNAVVDSNSQKLNAVNPAGH